MAGIKANIGKKRRNSRRSLTAIGPIPSGNWNIREKALVRRRKEIVALKSEIASLFYVLVLTLLGAAIRGSLVIASKLEQWSQNEPRISENNTERTETGDFNREKPAKKVPVWRIHFIRTNRRAKFRARTGTKGIPREDDMSRNQSSKRISLGDSSPKTRTPGSPNQFSVQRLGSASHSRQSSLSPAGNTLTLATPSTPSRKSSTDSEDSPSKMQDSEKYVLVPGLQMPLPGAPGAPWFKGDNVTAFLEQYDDMCEDYRVTPETKRIRLLRYISPIYKEQIRSMPEYSTENYLEKELYDALKKEFREHDWEHYRVSIEFLYRIIDQSTRGLLATKTYVDLFDRVSKELIKRNKLDKQHQGREFMRGLPMHVKERIFRETDYEPTEISTHNYDKMYEKAVAAYKYEEKKRRYNETNDPEYSKVRQEHLDAVVQRMIPNAANDLLLPVPPEPLMEEIQRRMYATAEKTHVEPQSSVPRATQTQRTRQISVSKPSTQMDDLARELEKLSLSSVSFNDLKTALDANTAEMSQKLDSVIASINQNQNQFAPSRGYGRGGSFSRGRGGYSNMGGGGHGASYGSTSAGPSQGMPPTVQGNAVEANAAYNDQQGERYCFGCFGRTKNGEVDPFVDHFFVDRCPLMDELVNRGCCHRENGQWCYGSWSRDRPSRPFTLRNNRRWYDQIIGQVAGGPFDYDLDKRPGNAQRIQESVQLAAQERSKASANREILRGPDPSSHTFNGNNVNVQSLSGATIDEFYEELPVNTVTANTVTTSKSRSKIQSARENLRRRARAEEKYPRAGSQRQTSQGAQNEEREEMDVDQSEDETLRQQSGARSDDSADEAPPRRLPKSTASLPRIQKGMKMITDALKTPNPAAVIANQWRRDNAHYLTLMDAGAAVAREMLGAVDPMKQLSQSLHRMSEGTSQPASVTGNPVILGANLVGADFSSLIKRRHIVVAPKLHFNLSGPIGSSGECGMLDTGAECCIAPTHIARDLGSAIANVEDFQLSTATGQNFGFAGVAVMKVEIEHGVGCEIPFFLVDSAKKILLGQPFVAAMKMQIEYRDDGSWDGVFRDPKDPSSTCTVMIVPPLKTYLRQATRNRHVRMHPRVEEASEEEYNAGN